MILLEEFIVSSLFLYFLSGTSTSLFFRNVSKDFRLLRSFEDACFPATTLLPKIRPILSLNP